MDTLLLHRLAIALGIGLIVGLERGWKAREQQGGERLAGIRTFSIAGLLGGALAAASASEGLVLLAAGALVLGALVVRGYALTAPQNRDFGMTTELALLATFALGALAARAPFEAAAAAIVMSLLLGFKAEFHHAIERLDRAELLATLQLLAIAAILVPLLPAREMGPFDALNPRVVGILVLLVTGLSYVGYFAMRLLGPRLGVLLTALLGGLSSSTAVTVAYARRAAGQPGAARLFGAGIAVAAAAMTPRLAIEIGAVNWTLLGALTPTFAVLAAVPALGGILLARRTVPDDAAAITLDNPLQLRAALGFAALLSALLVAVAGLQRALGEAGVYTMTALAALFDVDAVGIALAGAAAHGHLAAPTAERAVAFAVLVNTGAKAVLAALLGGPALRRSVSALLGVALAAGSVTAYVTLR
jgi:uncharacterized membrane protein (DUF4010 family)